MKKIKLMFSAVAVLAVSMQSCSKDDDKVKGCTDASACNFDSTAGEDDGTCTFATTWYQDLDGDGLGNGAVSVSNCDQPTGYVSNGSDPADLVVVAKQRSVVTYVGATWCPPCGAYGEPTKEHMETTYGSDVVILNVQSGDAISSSSAFGPGFGNVFQSFVGSTGIPHCYWSAANHTMTHDGYYSSQPYNNSEADSHVNACLGSTLEVGVAAEATIDGSVVSVNTMAEFYAAAGQHYIGVYLLEDGVMASQQSSIAATAVTSHENVIRAAANSSNSLGNETMGTSFTANQTVSGNYTITVPSSVVNSANLQVAVVIYKANQADGISNAVIVDVN